MKYRRRGEAGYVLILVAVSLPVFLGMLGLGIDVGYLRYMKWRMQAAADAAAVGGAHALLYSAAAKAAEDVVMSARRDAEKNGFDYQTPGVTVTVNNPPSALSPCSQKSYKNYCVEVIVSQPQRTFFMKVFGWTTVPVSARAVGILWTGPNCMYALNGTQAGTFKLTPGGGGYEVRTNCGIVVNSSSPAAMNPGTNHLYAGSIGIVGGCSGCGSNVTPTPTTRIPTVSDPLAYLPEPTVSGPVRANPNITAPGNYTLQPGNYTNGLTIGAQGTVTCKTIDGVKTCTSNGVAGPVVTFASGNYYITGGTFSVDGPKSDNDNNDGLAYLHPSLKGTEVFFDIGASAQVAIMGGGNGSFVNSYNGGLSAPTVGTYAGILFWQSRATPLLSYTARASSGLGDGWTGALYFPTVGLRYGNSNPNAAKYMILVAQTIELYRDMATVEMINYDTSGLLGGSPIKRAVLSE
jgi:hypothetical protein